MLYRRVSCLILAAVMLVLVCGSGAAYTQEDDVAVPVLLYHNIAPYVEGDTSYDPFLNISAELFESHMKAILNYGYTPITYGEYYSYVTYGTALPPRPILITFDDGYYSNYQYAYPILKQYGIKATIFVITDRRGMALSKNPHFSWNQAKEMQDSGLVDIQSHTYSHEILTTLSDFDLLFELKTSKNMIERHLGKKCNVLAFPQGIAGEREIRAAKEAGYLILNKVGDEGVNRRSMGLDSLKRLTVRSDWTPYKLMTVIEENMNR